jgi:hypothetical protein
MTKRKGQESTSHASHSKKIETPLQLRAAIGRLSPESPHTNRFAAMWRERGGGQQERKEVWYTTQQEHWLAWLSQYDGPGAYDRKGTNLSASFAYNHIVNPQMLVYLAEAAGVADALVDDAVEAALASSSTMSSMSSAIRKMIPWELVETRLVERSRTPRS